MQGPCDGCVRKGQSWFQKCPSDTKDMGGDMCESHCPQGTKDAGYMGCKRNQYTRASHKAMCNPNTQTQSRTGLWCYPKCQNNSKGFGPLCVGHCPSNTVACAGLLCLQPGQNCASLLAKFGGQLQQIMQA